MKTRRFIYNGCKVAAKQLWDIEEGAIDHLYYSGLVLISVAAGNVEQLRQQAAAGLNKLIPAQRWELGLLLPQRKN